VSERSERTIVTVAKPHGYAIPAAAVDIPEGILAHQLSERSERTIVTVAKPHGCAISAAAVDIPEGIVAHQ
jgi:hypothetical protein